MLQWNDTKYAWWRRRWPRALWMAATVWLLASCGTEAPPTDPTPTPPTIATVVVTPAADTLVSLGETVQLEAGALDATGGTVAGPTLTWSSSDDAVATVNADGLVTAVGTGTATILASVGNVSGDAAITVQPAVAALVFSAPPNDGEAGESIAPAVGVALHDAQGNVVQDATAPVTIALGRSPADGSIDGNTTVESVGGVAVFDDLTFETAGEYTVVATADGFETIESPSFSIAPGPAFRLVFLDEFIDIEANETLPDFRVAYLDRFDNVATGTTTDIRVSAPGSPTRIGTVASHPTNGIAVFSGVRIDSPFSGYRLRALSDVTGAAESDPFDVLLTYRSVSAGPNHTCAIQITGTTYCWGANTHGQLGDEVPIDRSRPQRLRFFHFSSIAAGGDGINGDHTCGITTETTLVCWGANTNGQLGIGSGEPTALPTRLPVAALDEPAAVTAGAAHTCAIGPAMCWGSNLGLQLGVPGTVDRHDPVRVARIGEDFIAISAGTLHTCGITESVSARCWGRNDNGQLGNSDVFLGSEIPVEVFGARRFTAISVGGLSSYGLTEEGEVYWWGQRMRLSQDGTVEPQQVREPELFHNLIRRVSVSPIGRHACGLLASGAAVCWDSNNRGQLGNGSSNNSTEPVLVVGNHRFAMISAGGAHSCGVTEDGDIYCWGANDRGQLGNDTNEDSPIPVPVFGTDPPVFGETEFRTQQ